MVVDTVAVKESHATRPVLWENTAFVVWQNDSDGTGDVWLAALHDGEFQAVSRVLEAQPRYSLVDVVVTPQGRFVFYFVTRHSDGIHYDHSVVISDVGGTTWSEARIIDPEYPCRLVTQPGSIGVSTSGVLYVVYNGDDRVLFCFRSGDGGVTWEKHPIAPESPLASSSLAVSTDGSLGVAWDWVRSTGTVRFARSSDGGRTWTSPVEVPNSGPQGNYYAPSIAVDGSGCWHASMTWNVPFTDQTALYYTTSSDSGKSWSPVMLLSGENVTGSPVKSMAVDTLGQAYLAWVRVLPSYAHDVVFQSNATPLLDQLQPNEEVLVRSERNPSRAGALSVVYQLISPGEVVVSLRDTGGRLVRHWNVGHASAGEHHLEWDGLTNAGRQVASGVYYWEVSVATDERVRRGKSSTVVFR